VRMSVMTLGGVLLVSLAGTAHAQYTQNFDGLNEGSLVGQDGFFQPVAGSNDFQVATFNNPLLFNVTPNPTGGTKTAVGSQINSANGLARSQNFVNWDAGPVWTICVDVWADYQGDPALHGNNVGSLSMQPFGATPYTNQGLIMLFYYVTPGNVDSKIAIGWNMHLDSGADVTPGAFFSPDNINQTYPQGAFSELSPRSWHRVSYVVNYTTNTLDKVAVTDLQTGASTTFVTAGTTGPVGGNGNWNMAGGAANAARLPMPTQFRFFGGGTAGGGNVIAFDNLSISLGDALCTGAGCPSADFNGDGFVDFFDYGDYVACFEGECLPGTNADFNGDGFVDFFDYGDFVFAFEGC